MAATIKTILITGSSGTVGTPLCQELTRRGFRVLPLDIKGSLWSPTLDRATIKHDLRKPLGKRLPGRRSHPDLIIHLAAHARVHDSVVNPRLAYDNFLMTYNILEYARLAKVERVLFASSREVYGQSKPGESRPEVSTDVSRIESPYTASKLSGESLCSAYRVCYGIDTVTVRLSNVYGKYDISERVIPYFLYLAHRDRPITVFGNKKLDFTYSDDCTDGLVRIAERFDSVGGLTFNISRGSGETLMDLARMIVAKTGSQSTISRSKRRTGEISSFVGDISRAKRKLGYRPKISLSEGLDHNIEWYFEAMRSPRVYQTQRRILAKRGWL